MSCISIKKFIIKNTIKVIVFIIISTIAMTLLQSPVISNEIAMGQMQNDNTLFMLMETYNNLRPIVSLIYGCIVVWFAATVGLDIYKFIKTKIKGENEK